VNLNLPPLLFGALTGVNPLEFCRYLASANYSSWATCSVVCVILCLAVLVQQAKIVLCAILAGSPVRPPIRPAAACPPT